MRRAHRLAMCANLPLLPWLQLAVKLLAVSLLWLVPRHLVLGVRFAWVCTRGRWRRGFLGAQR